MITLTMIAVRRLHAPLVAALLSAGLAGAAAAQALPPEYPRLVVEGRGGLAIPLGSFRDSGSGGEVKRAPTFGLHFVYRSPKGWGPNIGFSQHRFDCGALGCGDDYVLTTWDLGMQRTFGASGAVWLRAGFVFGRLERDFVLRPPAGPSIVRNAVSQLSVGPELGAGVRIPIRGRLALTPGARYDWLNTQFSDGPLEEMRWLTADLGVALGF